MDFGMVSYSLLPGLFHCLVNPQPFMLSIIMVAGMTLDFLLGLAVSQLRFSQRKRRNK